MPFSDSNNQSLAVDKTDSFASFRRNILKISDKRMSPQENALRRSFIVLGPAAVAMFFIDVFWAIFSKYQDIGLASTLGVSAITIQMVASALALAMAIAAKRLPAVFLRAFLVVFQTAVIISTTMLIIVKNIDLAPNIGSLDSIDLGVSLSSFCLFYVLFVQTPYWPDSIGLLSLIVFSGFVPLWFDGAAAYSIATNMILRGFIVAAYIVFMLFNHRTQQSEKETADFENEHLRLSYVDTLTDSLNRRCLDTYWEALREDRDVQSVGILLFDVDDFKKYNDYYSHYEGDLVLKEVCSRAQSAIKLDTTYLFRYGGEEFMIFIKNPIEERLVPFALSVCRNVYDANITRDDLPNIDRVTISIGMDVIDREHMNIYDYNRKADAQLYHAKASKKNCVSYKSRIYRE